MNKVNVRVKKLHDDAVIPQYSHLFDSGFDLVAVRDFIVYPGDSEKIPVGLAFELPKGYELQIRPRSGVSSKTKLRVSNAPGTVDAGYRGEVAVLIDNIHFPRYKIEDNIFGKNQVVMDLGRTYDAAGEPSDDIPAGILPHGSYYIKKGDRIAQGVIVCVSTAEFEVVDELDETERGTGAFGSSGVRA